MLYNWLAWELFYECFIFKWFFNDGAKKNWYIKPHSLFKTSAKSCKYNLSLKEYNILICRVFSNIHSYRIFNENVEHKMSKCKKVQFFFKCKSIFFYMHHQFQIIVSFVLLESANLDRASLGSLSSKTTRKIEYKRNAMIQIN